MYINTIPITKDNDKLECECEHALSWHRYSFRYDEEKYYERCLFLSCNCTGTLPFEQIVKYASLSKGIEKTC